jgi:hypothetical protein
MVAAVLMTSVFLMTDASSLGEQMVNPMTKPIEERVDAPLKQMSLAEKIPLCHGNSKFNTAGIKRLGISGLAMSDGPHGVRRETAHDSSGSAG